MYIFTYDLDPSLFVVETNPETLYKYLSTALMPEIVGVDPAVVGAEVTLPAVFDNRWRWDLVIVDSAFNGGRPGGGKAASSFAAAPYLKPIGKVERTRDM